jgi:hypothetical protein
MGNIPQVLQQNRKEIDVRERMDKVKYMNIIRNKIIIKLRVINHLNCKAKKETKTPWPESASELYRPNDRRLLEKLVPTFADRGVLRSQSN